LDFATTECCEYDTVGISEDLLITFLLACLREGLGIEDLLARLDFVLLLVLEVFLEKLSDPKLL
jgi:hypothetical protein